jgi:adenine deaminase
LPSTITNSVKQRKLLVDVALGNSKADIVIKRAKIVNVNTREILVADVAISDHRIAIVGDADHSIGENTKIIEANACYLIPGLIDTHRHIESSQLTLQELSSAIVPRGVTAIVEDPHEIANVLGLRGIRALFADAAESLLKVYLRVSAQVPAVPFAETSGGSLNFSEISTLLEWEVAKGFAGDVNPNLVLNKNNNHFRKIQLADGLGLTIGGQEPSLERNALNAYIAAGPEDSHVSVSAEEILTELRLGMKSILTTRPLMLGSREFEELWNVVQSQHLDTRHLMFCVDDRQVNKIAHEGDLDSIVRTAIGAGFDPVAAIQMATINAAEHYNLHDLGSISPGKIADLVLLEGSLEDMRAQSVLVNGRIVSEHGVLIGKNQPHKYPGWTKKTIHLRRPVIGEDFVIQPKRKNDTKAKVRGIKIGRPKREIIESLPVIEGRIVSEPDQDMAYIAVVERHRKSGRIGKAFVNGTGIKRGAMAASYCHDSHNIVVVGANRDDMAACVNFLQRSGGGFVATMDGRLLAMADLPVAGMISEAPYKELANKFDAVEQVIREKLDCTLEPNPFYWLTVTPLPNLPEMGITDKGLFDARIFEIVPSVIG